MESYHSKAIYGAQEPAMNSRVLTSYLNYNFGTSAELQCSIAHLLPLDNSHSVITTTTFPALLVISICAPDKEFKTQHIRIKSFSIAS